MRAAGHGHRAVVHAFMCHTHIRHRQERRFAEVGDISLHAFGRGERCAHGRCTGHGLGEDRVGLVLFWLHDDVIGLGNGNAELVDRNRQHVVPVRLHDRHLEPRDADVKIGHGRGIDEAKPDALARGEEAGPVLLAALAVDQRGEALQVLDVRRHHTHVAPGRAVRERSIEALLATVLEELEQCALLPVVVVRHHFEVTHDAVAAMRMCVCQLDHIFAVIAERLALLWLNDDRAIGPIRLLETAVAVEPVGAALDDREAVGECLTGGDAVIADAWHAVLFEGQDQPVPVDRGRLAEVVRHLDGDVLAFLKAQDRPGRGTIIADTGAGEGACVDCDRVDGERVFTGRGGARKRCRQTGAEQECPAQKSDCHG